MSRATGFGFDLSERMRAAALRTTPAPDSSPARIGTLGLGTPRIPTRVEPYDPADLFEAQQARRREQNRSLPMGDPARDSRFDCEPECSWCQALESECACGGPA